MMEVPRDLSYTPTHEWIRLEGDTAVVGITDFAQSQLSDLTYVELPAVGDTLSAQDEAAVAESVKAASDIYSPLSGTVAEVNEELPNHPELINTDPYGKGWMFKLTLSNPSEADGLLDADKYEELIPEGD